jgi:hypothetical protein
VDLFRLTGISTAPLIVRLDFSATRREYALCGAMTEPRSEHALQAMPKPIVWPGLCYTYATELSRR